MSPVCVLCVIINGTQQLTLQTCTETKVIQGYFYRLNCVQDKLTGIYWESALHHNSFITWCCRRFIFHESACTQGPRSTIKLNLLLARCHFLCLSSSITKTGNFARKNAKKQIRRIWWYFRKYFFTLRSMKLEVPWSF